ncbi:MAG: hypothetical protein QXG12_04375 [Thermoproteota archaeon]
MTESILKSKPNWLVRLIKDLSILIKEDRDARVDILLVRWRIGYRILKEKDNIEWGSRVNFIKELAEHLDCSWRLLYYCVELAERFGSESELLHYLQKFHEPPSWSWIVSHLLRGKPRRVCGCVLCGVYDEDLEYYRVCQRCFGEFIEWRNEKLAGSR